MTYLIHGAQLLDLNTRQQAVRDILICDGVVTDIAPTLTCPGDARVIGAQGLMATAGWIDAHIHLTDDMSTQEMLKNGVTWVQDAGSFGIFNFGEHLKNHVLGKKMPVSSYLYLAPWGIDPERELQDLSVIDLDAWERFYLENKDSINGIKLRIDPRVCFEPMKAMGLARELGDRLGLPVVVHASRCTEPMEDILKLMKKGDLFSHIYAKKLPGVLDADGNVKSCVWEAQKRGVHFELAHGNGNFSYEVCQKAFAQGFYCNAVSTDLHTRSLKNVGSLAQTMSKTLACGMDMWDILRKVTVESAQMLGISKACTIEVGKPADLVLFQIENNPRELKDSDGVAALCEKQFVPRFTFLGDACYCKESI